MDVLGIGRCTLEHIALVDKLPDGEVTKQIPKFSIQGGGTISTAVAALCRWGVSAGFIGKVGEDDRGQHIRETLADEGANTEHMVYQQGGISQFSFTVLARKTNRHQTYFTHGNVAPLEPSEIDLELVTRSRMLLCDDTELRVQHPALERASQSGIPTLLRATRRPNEQLENCMSYCDVFTTSETAASQYTGKGQLQDMCRAILQKGPEVVVVTLGDEGLAGMSRTDEQLVRFPAIDVDLVDTKDAGAIQTAALAYATLREWKVSKTLDFANTAAGLSCRGLGGRSAIPSLDDIHTHLQNHYSSSSS